MTKCQTASCLWRSRKYALDLIDFKRMNNRKILLDIAKNVLSCCAPKKLFDGVIPRKLLADFERVVIISIGKAAAGMAKAVIPMLGRRPDAVLMANEGHPLPTERGIKNTEKIIKIARSLGEKDLAIVLISGGGSAMLVSPAQGISLKDKTTITRQLLKSGATINEMNVVRKHLSQVKGGRLAALLYPATVLGFVISDVVGNDLSTITSGPLTPDKSTFKDAIKIFKKYKIVAPKSVQEYLQKGLVDKRLETPKPGEKYFTKVFVKILADHKTVLKKTIEKAKELGLKTAVIKKEVTGEARDEARKFIAKGKKGKLLIACGETTVTCCGNGCGGRNQEFVLAGLQYLKPGQILLSIGTDGVDGVCPEPIAGAVADGTTLKIAAKKKLKIQDFLKNNDSYNFFRHTGGLIKTGPTGTNLGDLMMLLT